jgi:hypothetical protein
MIENIPRKRVLLPALIVILIGCSVYGCMGTTPRSKVTLRTDRGRVIDDANRAKPFTPPVPDKPDAKTQKKDKKRGKNLVGHAEKRCNCVGFSLGRGDWETDTEELPAILEDNYVVVPEGKVRVCNIIVYGNPENGYDHVGLVVEVTPDGKPKVVRSKTTISDFIYDHPPDVEPFGADYKIYDRAGTDKLSPEQKQRIKDLQEAYDRISDKSSRKAHDAAARLCQEKNALLEA